MSDDITNVRVTLTQVKILGFWVGQRDVQFSGDVDGQTIPISGMFPANSLTAIALGDATWQRVVNVQGKASFTISLSGVQDDLMRSVNLGTVTATVTKDGAGKWPTGIQSKASENPAEFQLQYTVEPILALDPARPETAVVSRVVTGSLTATTLSGVPVRVRKINATVLTTPPKTLRAAPPSIANVWPAPVDLVFTSTTPLKQGALTTTATDFDMPQALVVIRNSAGPIKLEAVTDPPNVDVFFQAVRASDDTVAIGKVTDLPTIKQTGNATATMATDQRGSFYLMAFVDLNRNQKRDDDEPGVVMPVIMVEATIKNAARDLRSAPNPDKLEVTFDGVTHSVSAATYTVVNCSTGDFSGSAAAGASLDADVLLIGGGADGARGPANRVFAGWSNNVMQQVFRATYIDGRVGQVIQVSNNTATTAPTPPDGIPLFISTGPVPAPFVCCPPPLLDSGRNDNELGGQNITFGHSSVAHIAAAVPAPGQVHTVQAWDAPGQPFFQQHLDPARHTELSRVEVTFNCSTFLVVWTNTTGGAAPSPGVTNSVGFRSYTVIAKSDWKVFADYKITKAGGNYNLTATAPQSLTLVNKDHSPGITPANAGMEVRPPAATKTWAWDETK